MEPFLLRPASPRSRHVLDGHVQETNRPTLMRKNLNLCCLIMPNWLFLLDNERLVFHWGFIWDDMLCMQVDRMRIVTPHVANTARTGCFTISFLLPFFTRCLSTACLMSRHPFFFQFSFAFLSWPNPLTGGAPFLLHPTFFLLAFTMLQKTLWKCFCLMTTSVSLIPRQKSSAGQKTTRGLTDPSTF